MLASRARMVLGKYMSDIQYNRNDIYPIPINTGIQLADDFYWRCVPYRDDRGPVWFKFIVSDKPDESCSVEFEFEDCSLNVETMAMVERIDVSVYPEDILFAGVDALDDVLISHYVSVNINYNEDEEGIIFALYFTYVDQMGRTRRECLGEKVLYCSKEVVSRPGGVTFDLLAKLIKANP